MAARTHLLTMPLTTYILQKHHYERHAFWPSVLLVGPCILLSNMTAILLLCETPTPESLPYHLLCLAIALACVQMLWICEKRVVFRIMMSTSMFMLIIALLVVAACCSPPLARRFLQSAALPFALLFFETTRSTTQSQTPESSGSAAQNV
jgi:hypothetical protein